MRTTAQPLRTTAKLSPGTSASATRLLSLGTHAKSLGYKSLLYSGALAAMSMQFAWFVRDVKPRWICTSARTFTTHPHTCSHMLIHANTPHCHRRYLVAAMDVSRDTFRTALYPPYKQQRSPAPEELGPQVTWTATLSV